LPYRAIRIEIATFSPFTTARKTLFTMSISPVALESHLTRRAYIEGYTPSQADVAVFSALTEAPAAQYPHTARWYRHIQSYANEHSTLPASKGKGSPIASTSSAPAEAPAAAAEEDDDEVDLFGSDDEEADAEAEKLKQERLAAYNAKKAAKPKTIAKSIVTLDVKPWDDETDMEALEKSVRSIEKDGLVWGLSKLVPIGYGIRKLQINMVVEDEKISIDELQEEIAEFEDYVQSSDVQAMQKL